MNRKPLTVKGQAKKVVLKTLVLFVVAFAGFTAMAQTAHDESVQGFSSADEGKPLAVGSPEEIEQSSGCEEASGGAIPASVIVWMGHDWSLQTSEKVIGQAFEQLVFDGDLPANEWTRPVDHGFEIHKFCK